MGNAENIPFTEKLQNINDESYELLKNSIKKYSFSLTKISDINNKLINENSLIEEFIELRKKTDFNERKLKMRIIGNNNKNRYGDIGPFKDNKVPLNNNNYINASFINIPNEHSFIATQGPLDNTISDFWEMIIDYNVSVIIMLCNLKERNKIKCSEYWNKELIEKDNLFKLISLNLKEYNDKNLIIREIEIQKIGNWEIKKVLQLQFTGWSDHDVPNENEVYNTFITLFKTINDKGSNTTVIHCSAGVGRTGTFLSLIILYNNILNQKNENSQQISFSIFGLVRQLKEMRFLLVENERQYIFIYKFLRLFLEKEIFKTKK